MRHFSLLTSVLWMACRSDDSVKILNDSPEITIVSHDGNSLIREGELNQFRAQVSDTNHDALELEVAWFSGATQLCEWSVPSAQGESVCDVILMEDSNLIAEVRDPEGAAGADALQLRIVPTEAPMVAWQHPTSSGVYYSDVLIELLAEVSDLEDAPEELQASLLSSIDGEVAAELSINTAGEMTGGTLLSQGQHVLTINVEDTMGKVGSDVVTISVGPPNHTPSCEILSPDDGAPFVLGDPISFTAQVDDLDVPEDQLEVEWRSDKDGVLGSSTPSSAGEVLFSTTALTRDVHTITMSVSDELGATCSDLVQVFVGDYPSIQWMAPAQLSTHLESTPVSLSVLVNDTEDRAEDLVVHWESNVDGVLGELSPESTGEAKWTINALSVGLHAITATVTDLSGFSSSASLDLIIDGSPSAPIVILGPQPAYTADDLLATSTGAIDPEGQTVTYSYVWQENGLLTSYTGSTLSASVTEKGDVWTVVVTPNDGLQDGPSTVASIDIDNSNPIITGIQIVPDPPQLTDTLTCQVTAVDPDSEPLTSTVAWINQSTGIALGSGDTITIDGNMAQPGDLLLCTVTVTDPDGAMTADSGQVTLGNALPDLVSVEILPAEPTVMDTVECGGLVTDVDNQGHTLSAEWYVGSMSVGTGLSLDLNLIPISKGDTLRCELTAEDDLGGMAQASASVSVVNSPPVDGGLNIIPISPTVLDVLTCQYSISDPDSDVLSLTTIWTDSAGTELGTSAMLDVSLTTLQPGDSVQCDASATDSDGAAVQNSESIVIANTPPSVSNVAIAPLPTVGTVVGCTATVYDPDDQPLNTTYAWTNESTGQSLGTSASIILTGSQVSEGDVIRCALTVVDSYGEVAVGSTSEVIVNSPPQILQLQITPPQPHGSDTLLCSAFVFDPEGDSTVTSIDWQDSLGQSIGSGPELELAPLGVQIGDDLFCRFTATDSGGQSTTQLVGVSVIDGPPVISDLVLMPSSPTTDSLVTANVVVSDPEGLSVSLAYDWFVDGILMTETSAQISGFQFFDKGQLLSVTVTPFDGTVLGQPVSESVVIDNSLPDGLSLRLEPIAPRHLAQDLICEITTPATDADGDAIGYDFNWFVNGQAHQGNTQTTYRTGDTIPAAELDGGELWRCEVTPNDGEADGQLAHQEVEILPAFVDIGVGATYSCALDAAGAVSCWGSGSAASAPSGTFVDIEAGVYHACAQDSSGLLTCWGTNHSGSTLPPNTAFDDFSMGNSMTCAVQQSDSSLDCWGNTTDGRSNPPSGSFNVVNGGLSSSCALRSSDGVTQCWGENDHGKSTPPSTPFVDLSVGYNTACGLTAGGAISCWGRNHMGQFNVPSETWVDLSVGDTHVCAINAAGTAICWGDNTLGQSTPPLNDTFTHIELAVFHSCGLTDDGRVLCWGDDSDGQLTP
ncbi:MAG: hypothetical protein ACON4U_00350 [Myxococcota bacterium]